MARAGSANVRAGKQAARIWPRINGAGANPQIGVIFGDTESAPYLPSSFPRLYYFASNRDGLSPQTRIESEPMSWARARARTAGRQLGEAGGGKGRERQYL